MKKTFTTFLALTLLLPSLSFAQMDPAVIKGGGLSGYDPSMGSGLDQSGGLQTGIPGGMQTDPYGASAYGAYSNGGGSYRRSYGQLRSSGTCSFKSDLIDTDASLLAQAQTTLDQVEQSDRCAPIIQQTNQAYTQAIAAYRNLAGLDRAEGYLGSIPVTCNNYSIQYDNTYDRFVSDWQEPDTNKNSTALPMTGELALSCGSMATRAEAVSCATLATSRLKLTKQRQCEDQANNQEGRQRAEMQLNAIAAGMSAVQSLLRNNECVPRAGTGAAAILGQAGIQLATQAATIAVGYGSFASTLVGAAGSLMSTVVDQLFKRDATYAQQMRNYDDLQGLACMYEQVENRNLRCNSKAASEEMDANNGAMGRENSFSQQCLSSGLQIYQGGMSNFISSLQVVADRLGNAPLPPVVAPPVPAGTEAPAPAPAPVPPRLMDLAEYGQILDQLNRPVPGMGMNGMEMILQTTSEVVAKLQSAQSNPEELRLLAAARGAPFGNAAHRQSFRESLNAEITRTQNLNGIITDMKSMDSDEAMQNAQANLTILNDKIKTSGLGSGGVSAALESVLRTRQNADLFPTDSMASRIRNYQTQVGLTEMHRSRVREYQRVSGEANQSLPDGGAFGMAQSGLREFLTRRLNNEMERRSGLLSGAFTNITVGQATNQSLRTDRRQLYEAHISPMIKFCNQLRSVQTGITAGSKPNNINPECNRFICPDGMQNFPGLGRNDTCSGDCNAQYERFVCSQSLRLESIEQTLSNEFIERGTVCNSPVGRSGR